MKLFILTLGFIIVTTFSLHAQSVDRFIEKNKNRAIRKTEMRVDRKIDKGIDKSLDAADKGATKGVKSDAEKKEDRRKKKEVKKEGADPKEN